MSAGQHGWARIHFPAFASAPWLTPRLARCCTLAELAGFTPKETANGGFGRENLEVAFVPETEARAEAIVREGFTLASWSMDEGGIEVAIHRPELAEEALVEALAAAGRDPRARGRCAAVAPTKAEVRERAGPVAEIRPGLPGEWWVDGAEGGPGGVELDPGLRPPERVLGRRLVKANLTLATAESCTGGGILERLTAIPGSSDYVDRGWVTYSNEAKEQALGVPGGVLDKHGAVSEPVARLLVQGALERSSAGLAVSITGIAGPAGGAPEKPVGLVWLGAGRRGGAIRSRRLEFPGERNEVRWRSINAVLTMALQLLPDEVSP